MAEETNGTPTTDDKARYEALRKEILTALPQKKAVDRQLASIEKEIFSLETTYLNETATHSGGNIIQGFENYLKNQGAGRRKFEIHDQDRIFSNSSLTTEKSIALLTEEEEGLTPQDEIPKPPTAGVTTVVLPPATRNQELSVAQQRRIRDKEYHRRKRASVNRSTADSDEEVISAASTSSRRPNKRARLADDD